MQYCVSISSVRLGTNEIHIIISHIYNHWTTLTPKVYAVVCECVFVCMGVHVCVCVSVEEDKY